MKTFYRTIFLSFLLLCSLSLFCALCECAHNWTYTSAGDAGHTVKCTLCEETTTESHSLTSTKTPPSCDEPSVTTYSCSKCSYSVSYADGEPSADHTWSAYSVTKNATCEKEGVETRECSVCGAKENRAIEKTEHNYGDWKPHDEKWHIKYCKICGWAYKGSHRLDDGKTVSEATESKLGEITYTCRVCSAQFSRAVNISGTILVKTPENVLGNGEKYLLTDTGEEDTSARREVIFPGNHLMDISQDEDSAVSVYANASGGNYAGLTVSGEGASAEILPAGNGDTLTMEFLKLENKASIKLRIFNSDGTLAIRNAGGKQLFISQKKAADASSITLVMQIETEGNHIKGSARLYSSATSEITIGYGKDEYSVHPSGSVKLLGQGIWDYHKTSGKLTVNALNEKENADGIVYSVIENNVHLLTASNIKRAQGTVKTSSDAGIWRLRITFPCGYAIETPGYLQNGAFKNIPKKALMDENDASNAISEPTETVIETEETDITDVPEASDSIEPVTSPAETPDAPPVLNGTAELTFGTEASYTSKDLSSLTAVFDGETLTLNASELPGGYTFVSAVFTETGAGFRFKINTVYSLPAVYEVPCENISLSAEVLLKDSEGNTRTLSCGSFIVSAE